MWYNIIMSEMGEKPRHTLRGKIARLFGAAALILAGTQVDKAAGGAISSIPGNVAQAGKEMLQKGANTAVEWDNRGFEASSAGRGPELGEAMKERDQRDQAQAAQVAKDQAESDVIRQKLGTQKNLP